MDWIETDLGNEIELKYGKGLSEQNRVPGAYHVFGSNGVVGNHKHYLIKGPGIIVGRKGSLGKVAFSESDFWPIDTTYFVDNKNQNNWYYLYYLLIFFKLDQINSHSTVPGLNREQVYPIAFKKPSTPEQLRIAAILHKIQKAIEVETKLIQTTRELKKSTMNQLFMHGLRGENLKETEIGLVPQSWEIRHFNDIAFLSNGFAFRSIDTVKTSGVQLIRMGNLYKNKLDLNRNPIFYPNSFAEKYSKFLLHAGDMIISLTGTMGKEDYGFTVKIPQNISGKLLLNQRVAKIVIHNKKVVANYLFYYLLSRQFLDRLYPTAKGTKQGNLSSMVIHNLLIAVPKSLEEQQEIAQILQTIDQKIEIHEKKKTTLQDLFKTMLYKLMTAEIRVHDLEIDTSEVV